MVNSIIINKKIKKFKKTITVSGDKSISIRWVLLSSLANGISKSKNLLMSEDVFAAINCIRKFGIKVIFTNGVCKIFGKGINGFEDKWDTLRDYKYHIVIENSSFDDYWTEKLADNYLAECFPFYHGCKNINKYFDKNPNADRTPNKIQSFFIL